MLSPALALTRTSYASWTWRCQRSTLRKMPAPHPQSSLAPSLISISLPASWPCTDWVARCHPHLDALEVERVLAEGFSPLASSRCSCDDLRLQCHDSVWGVDGGGDRSREEPAERPDRQEGRAGGRCQPKPIREDDRSDEVGRRKTVP